MKTHQLSAGQMEKLLETEQVGTLATVNEDGSPYTTPVHFLYQDARLYIHGLPAGKKLDNLKRISAVCFSVYRMDALLFDEAGKPCDTNTRYQSVIIQGNASILADAKEKACVLDGFVNKYTPHLSGVPLPENRVKGTGVISVAISEMTGKYWE